MTPPAATLEFCQVYEPVYTSRQDTEQTRSVTDRNNAVWLEKCEQTPSE